jgi:hypothetical protein
MVIGALLIHTAAGRKASAASAAQAVPPLQNRGTCAATS